MPPTSAPSPSGARRTPCWARRWGKNVQWSMKAWSRNRRWVISLWNSKLLCWELKAFGVEGAQQIHDLMEDIIHFGKIPTEWEQSIIFSLYKGKGVALARWNYWGLKWLDQVIKGSREDGWELPTTTNAHQWHAIWPLVWTQHHRCHIHCMPVTRIVPCHQHETVHGLCQSGILHH